MPRPLGYKHRDAIKLEARRFAALARLRRGESTAVVARSLGVCKQSVKPVGRVVSLARRRKGCAADPKTGGPLPKLANEKLALLPRLLEQGPSVHGFDTPVWTTERIAR